MLALLTWLNPLWAYAAVAAVAIPLIAHLLSQQGGPVVEFPTVRFLRQAIDETRRRTQLRDLLLLLLRCLALGLIVAAFARPTWTATQASAITAAGADVYFIIDRTASMTRTKQGATLFDEAKELVARQLRPLDPRHDRASVIVLDRQPRSLLPSPSAGFSRLIELVTHLSPGYERGDVSAALRQIALQVNADDASRSPGTSPRPVHVQIITDAQATQWPPPAALASQLPRQTVVRVRTVGDAGVNLALRHVAVTPSQPAAGQPAQVEVELACFASKAMQPVAVTVRLAFEGRSQVQVIQMPPNVSTTASFTVVPTRAGIALVELSAESSSAGDTLRADDRAGLAVTVVEQRPVMFVTAAKVGDVQSAAYFVERALTPQVAGVSPIALQRTSPADLAVTLEKLASAPDGTGAGQVPGAPPLLVIVEAGPLLAGDVAALHRFIAKGGGAIWFIDSEQAVQSWRAWTAQLAASLPAASKPAANEAHWVLAGDFTLAAGRFDDPILRVFTGAARAELLRQPFRAVMRTVSARPPLLAFSDGSPALLVDHVGAGRVAAFAADVSPRSSDWVKGPSFAPLLHQLVHHLSPMPPVRVNPQPGEVVELRPASDRAPASTVPLILHGPDEQQRPIDAHAGVHRFTPVEPGRYVLSRAAAEPPLAATFVEIDPDESDLRSTAMGTGAGPGAAAAGEGAAGLRAQATELWPVLIAAAIALLILEVFLIRFEPLRLRSAVTAP